MKVDVLSVADTLMPPVGWIMVEFELAGARVLTAAGDEGAGMEAPVLAATGDEGVRVEAIGVAAAEEFTEKVAGLTVEMAAGVVEMGVPVATVTGAWICPSEIWLTALCWSVVVAAWT